MHFEEAKWGYSDRLTPGAKAVVGMLGWLGSKFEYLHSVNPKTSLNQLCAPLSTF